MLTTGDIITEFLVSMGVSTSQTYYTDTILNTWLDRAYQYATSAHKWPFTERRDITQAWSSGTEDYAYPSDFKSDSIRLLQVGGYWLQKLDFNDYEYFREYTPNVNQRVYSDFGRRYYINPNLDVSGTITAWGQYQPAVFDHTDPSLTTVFSAGESIGNEAILEKMMAYANVKEKAPVGFVKGRIVSASMLHDSNAKDILDKLWQDIGGDQYQNQTRNTPMFKRIDVVGGYTRSTINSINQFL